MEKAWLKTKNLLINLVHFEKRNKADRYVSPLIIVLIGFLIKIYFNELLGEAGAFLLLTFLVTLSSWYGGLGPGLLATFISALANYFLFLNQDYPAHPVAGDLILTAIFILEGLIISAMSEARYESEIQKDEFVSLAAHELKNPLSSILGFAELINMFSKNEKISTYASEIKLQTERMVELINDMLDITKIEIGKFSYKEEPFNVDKLVAEVVSHQKIIARNRAINLLGKAQKVMMGDRYRIGQVITNLVTNALKYSPIKSKVVVKLKSTSDKVLISIRDYGIGIARADQKEIFDRFYRTTKAQKNKAEGLGLGLFISSQIVKHYSGKLYVKSKENHGSTFVLELPINGTKLT